jgi:superfamily I DNA/RNA helicase
MEILTTAAFLEQARGNPEPVRNGLRALGPRQADGVGYARQLSDRRLLGFSRQQGSLNLLFVAPPPPPGAPPPLASFSKRDLREIGVADGLIRAVQTAESFEALASLGLPAALRERLQFLLAQQSGAAPSSELIRQATSLDHLDRYLRGEITELLLNLDPGQRQIVALSGPGPIIVRGVAGSGKTAVALHRIFKLLGQGSLLGAPRVLFLTFNRALAHAASELLETLGIRPGDLEVTTLHHWCLAFARPRGKVLGSTDRRAVIRQARDEARKASRASALWGYPLAFWEEEIHRIKGSLTGGLEEYLKLTRHGAGRPLDPKARALVWQVFEGYGRLLSQRGALDFDDGVRLALEKLTSLGEDAARYDHVVVDEAQDLTILGMRLAAALTRKSGTLLVSYDPAQSIYERGFRWKSCGIAAHGSRSFDLRANYRNTAEILETARPLLSGMSDFAESGESKAAEEVLEPYQTARRGASPLIVEAPAGHEPEALAAHVARTLREEGIPPGNVAVLCYPNAMRDRVFAALQSAGVLCQKHDSQSLIRLADRSVKVLPLLSAKGLEFPVVYVMASGRSFQPMVEGDVERRAWIDRMTRAAYMALTRAMARLVIVHARGDPAFFVPKLGSARHADGKGNGQASGSA